MPEQENIPRLRRSVREAYHAGTASPWLKTRILAEINASARGSFAWKKFAGGVLVICMFVVAGNLPEIQKTGEEPGDTIKDVAAFNPSSYHLAGIPGAAIEVPGIAALDPLPDLNHIHVPGLARYKTSKFCIYSQRGEKSC